MMTPCELVHVRQVRVEAFDLGDNKLLLRGTLEDDRPRPVQLVSGGIGPPGIMHGLRLDMTIKYPDLTITSVEAAMPSTPQDECQAVLPSLQELVGERIVPGFTSRVKRLFGGPRGCAHFVSLILAMAPVAVQGHGAIITSRDEPRTPEFLNERLGFLRNTCKAWAERGPLVRRVRRELGLDEL